MFTANPYERVDIDAIPISQAGVVQGLHLFHIKTSAVKPFDACVFRQNLVDFLFDNTRDEWHLGNNDRYVQFSVDDLSLVLSERDAERFISYGWLV